MTHALRQRSRYQCALKNAPLIWGIPSIYRDQKLRRLKFPVISIKFCSFRKDVSMVIVAEGTFKQKTQIKNLVSSISIFF